MLRKLFQNMLRNYHAPHDPSRRVNDLDESIILIIVLFLLLQMNILNTLN